MNPRPTVAAAIKPNWTVVFSSVRIRPRAPCKAPISWRRRAENFVRRQAMDPNPKTNIVIRAAISSDGFGCWRKYSRPRKATTLRSTVPTMRPATVVATALCLRVSSACQFSVEELSLVNHPGVVLMYSKYQCCAEIWSATARRRFVIATSLENDR